jgi:hypothetical protein
VLVELFSEGEELIDLNVDVDIVMRNSGLGL